MKYRDYAYWAYIAGLIDGEGCISITKRKPSKGGINSFYTATVRVKMMDGASIDFLGGFAGGSVYPDNYTGGYEWCVRGDEIIRILKKVLPFLKAKRDQAELVIRFRQYQNRIRRARFQENRTGKGAGSNAYPKHIIDRLDWFYTECRRMKKEYTNCNRLQRLSEVTPEKEKR